MYAAECLSPGRAPALLLGCLDGEGLHGDNLETAFGGDVLSVDEALNALFDLQASDTIAAHAAAGFNRTGAGIMRWYVLHVATEATGERNWLRAWETVERMVAREAQRRRILNREAPER